MGPTEINGLPAHPLLVHAVVVLVPLSALLLVLSVCWPTARRRLGIVTPLVAFAALVAVPVATHAGRWLSVRVGQTPLLAKHIAIGGQLLPWVFAVFVIAAAHWLVTFRANRLVSAETLGRAGIGGSRGSSRSSRVGGSGGSGGSGGVGVATATATRAPTRARTTPKLVTVVFLVLSLAAGGGAVWTCYRIGDSGSKAVYTGNFTEQPRTG